LHILVRAVTSIPRYYLEDFCGELIIILLCFPAGFARARGSLLPSSGHCSQKDLVLAFW